MTSSSIRSSVFSTALAFQSVSHSLSSHEDGDTLWRILEAQGT